MELIQNLKKWTKIDWIFGFGFVLEKIQIPNPQIRKMQNLTPNTFFLGEGEVDYIRDNIVI